MKGFLNEQGNLIWKTFRFCWKNSWS